MGLHNLKSLSIAKRNIKDIPVILKALETAKNDLYKYQYSLYIELVVQSIDEAIEELGYTFLKSQEVIKNKGKL